ncbi:protein-tyrosine phosphatase [Saccharothrix saharensis]|uniref:Protein-tyrosine phosphatase n=1 Tax=Saccharothrix saharensis TaxID=571190 RepID=A0A543JQU0_9PSEU|nr:tyrosine-protein phosphatase [Saccharothrix saharensis]TQM85206.1 protein-tyrosine phosphatase [Saccharothrix saharensis]
MDVASRFLDIDGLFNFRDLGGYRTEDGRSVAWGRLYRSDGLHRLTGRGAAAFLALGAATVLDLRTAAELSERTWEPPPDWPGRLLHVPLLRRVPDWSALPSEESARPDFAVDHYREIAVEGASGLRAAVEALAAPDALPAVFHCAAGKDRTGVLAAFVLRLLGVPAEDVADDYALSETATARWQASVTAGGEDDTRTHWSHVPPSMLTANRETMLGFLRAIEDEHGSPAGFATALGLRPTTLDRLRAALLD